MINWLSGLMDYNGFLDLVSDFVMVIAKSEL